MFQSAQQLLSSVFTRRFFLTFQQNFDEFFSVKAICFLRRIGTHGVSLNHFTNTTRDRAITVSFIIDSYRQLTSSTLAIPFLVLVLDFSRKVLLKTTEILLQGHLDTHSCQVYNLIHLQY